MRTPTVLVDGFAYRLDPVAGKLEHTRASLALLGNARWIAITVRTENAVRAATALAVLNGCTVHGMEDTFQLSTRRIKPSDLSFVEAMSYPDRGTEQDQADFLDAVARKRRRAENARDLQRIQAKHDKRPDPKDIAAEKGLRIWNGGEPPSFVRLDAKALGIRHNENVHIYGCAPSRLALIRMVADLRGGDGHGVSTRVTKYWNEGAWGVNMAGIEPEPGLWVQHRHTDKPVRIWPKEKANG